MKKSILTTSLVIAAVIGLVIVSQLKSGTASQTPTQSEVGGTNRAPVRMASIPSRTSPEAALAIQNEAEQKSVSLKDEARINALMDSLARTPEERHRYEEEKQWCLRWQKVKNIVPMKELHRRLSAGEEIKSMEIPGLDGDRFRVQIKNINLDSPDSMTLSGTVEGQEFGTFVMDYYHTAESGMINLPDRGVAIEFDGHEKGWMIAKEYDPNLRDKAHPCGQCAPSVEGGKVPLPADSAAVE